MFDFKDNLGRSIAVTQRHMARIVAKRLERYGIGAGQYPILLMLFIEDGQSQQSLADRMAVDKAAALRAINKLEKSGYVKRMPDETDKRAFRIRLTAKARKIRGRLESTLAEVLDVLQQGLTPRERKQAAQLMAKVFRNAAAAR